VYWGVPNIAQYLPSNHSAIVVSGNPEFEHDPKRLAEYLRFLDSNPVEYQAYFGWKTSFTAREHFKKLTAQCYLNAGCRICNWVKQKRTCKYS
jgi:hypothetical protein